MKKKASGIRWKKGSERKAGEDNCLAALLLLVCFSSVLAAAYKASGKENTMVHNTACVCACACVYVCATAGRAAMGVEVQRCALFITCQRDANPVQQLPGDQWARCPRK